MMRDLGAVYACKIQEVMRQADAKMASLVSAQIDDTGQLVFSYKASADDMNNNAEMATAIVRKQNRRVCASNDIIDAQNDAVIQGDGFVLVSWSDYQVTRYMPVNPIDSDDASESGDTWTRLRRLYKKSGPRFRRISPCQVDMDPWIGKLQDQPCIVINDTATLTSLQAQAAQGVFDVDALKEAAKQGSATVSQDKMRRPDGETPVEPENVYQVRTVFWDQDIEIVLVGDVIVRCQRLVGGCDGFPLFQFSNHKKPDQAYGEGDAYILHGDQTLLNLTYSFMVTGSVFRSSPMFTGPSSANPASAGIMFGPGAYIPNDTPTPITPLQMPPPGDLGPGLVDFIRGGMQRARGISDVLSGGGKSGTATEYSGRRFTGSEMAMTDLQRSWHDSLVRMFRYEYLLNSAYLEDDDAVVLGGPRAASSFVTAGPGSFSDPHVEVDVEFTLDVTPENQARMSFLFKSLYGNPQINQIELLQEFLKAYGVRSKTIIIDPSKHQQRALDENAQLKSQGVIGAVLMQDDHMQHVQAHMSDPAISNDPALAAQIMPHIQAHMSYMQQQQQMQSQMQSMQPASALPPVQQAANTRTEAQFGNANTGASQ